jgi:hypothetical protein
MRWLVCMVLLGCAAAYPLLAGPIDGPHTKQVRIEAGPLGPGDKPTPGKRAFQFEFRGGERACVIAVGDHKPVVPMAIVVVDEKMTTVAEDYGSEQVPDFVAAIWYPPRTAKYTVIVQSVGKEYNEVYLTVR